MVRRIAEVAIAVLVGAGIVGVMIALNTSDPDEAPTIGTTAPEASGPEDPGLFLAAYERSLTSTYLTRGTFTAYRDDIRVETLAYKRVRMGGQLFEQEGESILKIDGPDQQLCFQQLGQTDILCGDPTPASSMATALQPIRDRLLVQAGETTPDYVVRSKPDGCWLVTGTKPQPSGDWGQSTTWCFDSETGALVYQETVSGTRLTIREATQTVGDVAIEDFAPDRR